MSELIRETKVFAQAVKDALTTGYGYIRVGCDGSMYLLYPTAVYLGDGTTRWMPPGDFITEEEARAADEAADILRHKDLRDRFAIAAVPSMVKAVQTSMVARTLPMMDDPEAHKLMARKAYEFADAMMEARDR